MKYCRNCKLRAKDSDTVCARCGGELTELGTTAAPVAATADRSIGESSGPALSLQGQIRELQHVQQLNVRRGRMLAAVCVAVLALLLLVIYRVYANTVLSYAVLRDVEIRQDRQIENKILVSFDVVQPGRVAFDRSSGIHHTEKLDVYSRPGRVNFFWTWPSDRRTGIDFRVVYRGGFTRTVDRRHFDMSPPVEEIRQ